jgi:hypothetical protein
MSFGTRAKAFEKGNSGNRPEVCTDEHLQYLDDLRESGDTNMFGARPYLMSEFPALSGDEAAAVLGYWMKSFSDRHPQ